MFENKVVVVTGAASGIGSVIAKEFRSKGAIVCTIDVKHHDGYVGDLSKKEDIESFVSDVVLKHKKIDILINNAIPLNKGIKECAYDEFDYALKVGVTAPFYLSKLFMDYFLPGSSIINISSTRAFMSQANTESYSSAKGAIISLTHALAMSLSHKVRVNSVSPGWIDVKSDQTDKADHTQHPVGRVGHALDVVHMIMYLASDQASFITGQDFVVDGGMSKQMIYHQDNGWYYSND